jgi:hypothetical protein
MDKDISDAFDVINYFTNITPEIVAATVNSLIKYLLLDDNLNKLTSYYGQDAAPMSIKKNNNQNSNKYPTGPKYPTSPRINIVGHIKAALQEKILEEAILDIDQLIYKQNAALFNYYDGKQISVKDVIDFYILASYHPDFL